MLPIPNKHVISLFEILYGSNCSGVLQKYFSFVQWIVLKPVGVKFTGGGGEGKNSATYKRQ
jgi:hypothetical protein